MKVTKERDARHPLRQRTERAIQVCTVLTDRGLVYGPALTSTITGQVPRTRWYRWSRAAGAVRRTAQRNWYVPTCDGDSGVFVDMRTAGPCGCCPHRIDFWRGLRVSFSAFASAQYCRISEWIHNLRCLNREAANLYCWSSVLSLIK